MLVSIILILLIVIITILIFISIQAPDNKSAQEGDEIKSDDFES